MKHKWVLQDKNTGHFAKEDGNYSFRIDDANLYSTRALARNDCLTSETVKKVLVEVRLVEKPKKKKIRRWKNKAFGLFASFKDGLHWLETVDGKTLEIVYKSGKRAFSETMNVDDCERMVRDGQWVEF